jgi:hypothetical protein
MVVASDQCEWSWDVVEPPGTDTSSLEADGGADDEERLIPADAEGCIG